MHSQLTDHQVERRRKRRRGIVALLGAVSILTIGAGSISLAQFTDSDSSTWAFTTGTIDINSNPAVLTAVSGMMPGGSSTQALTISNDGSGDLRYAMSVAATNALGSALQLTVKAEDAGGGCAAFTGASVLATTTLNGAGWGSSAQGFQAGDRNLTAGTNEILCFRVSLPLATDDTYQGASSAATFTFAAEQTANNP
ncbi:MAG TPA: TasA family protein [Candidatus Limnocylindrales bacterium]|nr:TasA family protein [Candidatus Limnocylindrales bacterium]